MSDEVVFGVTACSKSKRGGPDDEVDIETDLYESWSGVEQTTDSTETYPARELYDSWLFDGRVKALEAHCDEWCIFSAKHGYVEPDEELAWYDVRLSELSSDEQRKRARDVAENITDADRVMILMGREYADVLKEVLPDGLPVWDPLEGVGLYDQGSELADLIEEGRPTTQVTLTEATAND